MEFSALLGPSSGPLGGPFELKSSFKISEEAPGPLLDNLLDPPKQFLCCPGCSPRRFQCRLFKKPSRDSLSTRFFAPLGGPEGAIWGRFQDPEVAISGPRRHLVTSCLCISWCTYQCVSVADAFPSPPKDKSELFRNCSQNQLGD